MDERFSILVVDDHRPTADAFAALLRKEGAAARSAYSGEEALRVLAEMNFDLVLTDLSMEPVDGLQVVRFARGLDRSPQVIVFTGHGTVEAAVEAMRLGAMDFLTKPVSPDALRRRVAEIRGLTVEAAPGLVGESPFIRHLRAEVSSLAHSGSTLLLGGEPGVGRSALARWLHAMGPLARRPFMVTDLSSALDPSSLEGAGMVLVRRVETLDTAKTLLFLRLLDDLEARDRPFRLAATVSPSLQWEAERGSPQAELYFRLAVLPIQVPPLRERPEDVLPLLRHFAIQRAGSRPPVLPLASQEARLLEYPWPGNVRELANLVERALVRGPVAYDEIPRPPARPGPQIPLPVLEPGFDLAAWLDETERALLVRAIEATGGDRGRMSEILGVERNALRYKLKKYDLLGPVERP